MNLNHLSDTEFINSITLKSDIDPTVKRLIKIITMSNAEKAVDELVKIGMDTETWEMNYEGLYVSPAEYIRKLENELEYRANENSDLEFKLEQSQQELKEMQTRSIANLIQELNQALRTADYLTTEANKETLRYKKDAENAKEQLKMWSILASDTTQKK